MGRGKVAHNMPVIITSEHITYLRKITTHTSCSLDVFEHLDLNLVGGRRCLLLLGHLEGRHDLDAATCR